MEWRKRTGRLAKRVRHVRDRSKNLCTHMPMLAAGMALLFMGLWSVPLKDLLVSYWYLLVELISLFQEVLLLTIISLFFALIGVAYSVAVIIRYAQVLLRRNPPR